MTAGARVRRVFCALLSCALSACYLDNPGDAPPRGALYFPNALALSQVPPGSEPGTAPRYLFVANSNFDLRYKAGSLQALDLDALHDRLQEGADCTSDAPCQVETLDLLAGEVLIGSYSTGLALTASGERLVVTTRTEDSLGYVELDEDAEPLPDGPGVLSCADGEQSPCGLADRGLDRRAEGEERLDWPAEPAAVLSGRLADFDASLTLPDDRDEYTLVAHRNGPVSLFVEQGSELVLTDVLPSGAPFAASLAFDPQTRYVYAALAQFSSDSVLTRMRVLLPLLPESGERSELRAFVAPPSVVRIGGSIAEPRDLSFLPAIPDASSALSTPSAVVLAGRPSALQLTELPDAETADRPGSLRVKQSTVLGFGAARLATAVVAGVPLAVVSSFDSREVAVVDLRTMRTRSMRPTLSGPFDIALDVERRYVYVTDFRSSVLRVIDLEPLLGGDADGSLGVIATVGRPRVIQELQ
jgi:D-serine deaminase-like pyridoxal phosphate-dependent protein